VRKANVQRHTWMIVSLASTVKKLGMRRPFRWASVLPAYATIILVVTTHDKSD